MTDTTDTTATSPADQNEMTVSPMALGYNIVALDRLITSDLNDYNHMLANPHIEVLNDLTSNLDDLTDSETREVLTGVLRALNIRHSVAREDTTLTDTPPDTADTPGDTAVPRTPCGHHHTLLNYANGCAHGTHLARAITAAHNDDHTTAAHHAAIADSALSPLADINNPDSLRDFIAGTNAGLERHLRNLGTRVPS